MRQQFLNRQTEICMRNTIQSMVGCNPKIACAVHRQGVDGSVGKACLLADADEFSVLELVKSRVGAYPESSVFVLNDPGDRLIGKAIASGIGAKLSVAIFRQTAAKGPYPESALSIFEESANIIV